MTTIMLFHVRSKYTAVGRKEIVLFFYMYMFVELLAIFLDSAIIPTAHAVYPVSQSIGPPGHSAETITVVRSGICWSSRCALLVYSHQRLRRISAVRGRNTDESLGLSLNPKMYDHH
jgi:hypothetical protein